MTTSNTLALFIPSKGRPYDGKMALASAYRQDVGIGDNDVVLVLDGGPQEENEYIGGMGLRELDFARVLPSGRKGFVDPMNAATDNWLTFPPYPKYVGFMGDDHRIRTDGHWWDLVLDRDEAFVYGDDLFQGVNLPTFVFIRSDVVKALGYFAPPVLQHLFADNAWLELGKAAGSIHYEPRLIIEHMHPAAGKGVMDELKAELNHDDMYSRDRQAFEKWRHSSAFTADVEKIKECLRAS